MSEGERIDPYEPGGARATEVASELAERASLAEGVDPAVARRAQARRGLVVVLVAGVGLVVGAVIPVGAADAQRIPLRIAFFAFTAALAVLAFHGVRMLHGRGTSQG